MIDFESLSARALSIRAAAFDAPNGIAIRTANQAITYDQLLGLVESRIKTLVRPKAGRPYILVGENTLDVFVTLYALLEERIPFLLLHPTLTEHEKDAILQSLDAIQDPVPNDVAAILLTSGTSGTPKPAMLTRGALVASAYSSAQNITLSTNDAWLMSLSVSRIGGLSILTRSLIARSRIVLFPHFCAKDFIAAIKANHITLASIVPTMLIKLMDEFPNWTPPKAFRTILLGGASASQTLLTKAKEKGLPIVTTYGMTETASNIVTSSYKERFNPKATPKANALAELKIENETIRVRGPMVMRGYWGHTPLKKGAWFDTGDIGEIDENGAVTVHARRTDLIVTGGENVYPTEVELALNSIEGIKASLVLGTPDETWGAIVTALLVAKENSVTDEALKEQLKKRLSPFKCPRRIAWVKELPQTSAGKPNRNVEVLTGLTLHTLHYTR